MAGVYVKPWLGEDPAETRAELMKMLEEFKNKYDDSPTANTFKKQCAVSHVYTSNKFERTLPAGVSEHQTYQILDALYDSKDSYPQEQCRIRWHAKGTRSGRSCCQQLTQHLMALRYLTTHCLNPTRPLTVVHVLECHRILMNGALEDDGTEVLAGQLRQHNVQAGDGHVYPDYKVVERALERLIKEYNTKCQNGDDFILNAVWLFYEVITLHPFGNGNGRLCCLLLACGLQRGGFPFPIIFSSGHKKARQHYLQSIKRARILWQKDDNVQLADLVTLTLTSMSYCLKNFFINARYSTAE